MKLDIQPKLVLENDLLLEFEKFKSGQIFNKKKVQQLLHYYKPPHTLNREQKNFLENNRIKLEYDELNAIIQTGLFNLSLEELAQHTKFKVILSSNKYNFPYINISNDRLENNFSATFKSQEERTKAIEHFTSLFRGAKAIFVCDKFLKVEWLDYLIRQCQINTRVVKVSVAKPNNLNASDKISIQAIEIDIIDTKNTHYDIKSTHDRYIEIDDKIQIILTSGLEHFMLKTKRKNKQTQQYEEIYTKDFTYILREINKDLL